MVDATRNLCHKSPGTIYEIQVAGEELQVIQFKNPKSSTKITYKSHASATNKSAK
jgi:hypothetical protein